MPDRLDKFSPAQRAKLAKLLAAKKHKNQALQLTILPRSHRDDYPLSLQQEQLWLIDQLEPGNPAYNIHAALRIAGPLAPALLQESFRRLMARHEVLRAWFDASEGRPRQQIAGEAGLDIAFHDLRERSEEEKHRESRRISDDLARTRFDLSRPPLMRAALLRMGPHEHIFLLTMHHIIVDGWSMSVLLKEFVSIYEALVAGKEPDLPDLPIQYADYAAWQRAWIESDAYRRQLAFWREQMTPLPRPLQLHSDYPRPDVQRIQGLHHEFLIPKALVSQLQTLAREQNATLFNILLAGFKALLARYTGQDDIVVGAPVANRPFPELETLLGYFVNPLPLRTDLSGDPAFLELLARERDANQAAFERQSVPFENLVQAVQPRRSLAYSPLFQTLFTLQNLPRKLEAREVRFEPLILESGTVKFDITLTLEEDAAGLRGWLGYRTDLFHPDAIARMARNYVALLTDAVAHPEKRLSQLAMLDEEQRRELAELGGAFSDQYSVFSEQYSVFSDQFSVAALFERQVEATPEAIAILAPDELLREQPRALTYAELDARANQLAHALIARGVTAETRVGLMLPRSPELIIALLGVLKAGGVYVPLDPNYPPERLRFMLEDSGAELVISEQLAVSSNQLAVSSHQSELQRSEVRGQKSELQRSEVRNQKSEGSQTLDMGHGTLDTSTDNYLLITDNSLSTYPDTPPDIPIHPDNAAYIIYTSGTTGRPKGVVITHRGLGNYIRHAARSFGLAPEDRVLQFSSISFDAAAEEIYPTLISGATLALRTDSMIGSARTFIEASAALGITVWDMATAFFHQLIVEMDETGLEAPDSLRLVVFGGEKVQPALLRQWFRRVGDAVRLLNTYGPTETTIVATESEIIPEKLDDALPAPIGRPVSNIHAWVVDAAGELAPRGVVGELLIGGAGVARGYLHRPDLTAEKFAPDPFAELNADGAEKADVRRLEEETEKIREDSSDPRHPRRIETPLTGQRLYRTGDLVRWNIRGELEFHGRADHQVKVRGYRIELGEIEARLLAHPRVKEALARVFERANGDNRLAAYVTYEGDPPTVADLHAFLKQSLPDYMIPAHFFILDAFPLAPTGKVDLKALPSPDGHRPDLGRDFAPPRDALEAKLAKLWAEVLGVDAVGVHDNFFELGGDSLRAAIVINRLQAALDVVIYAVALFDAPTIAQLAEYLRARFPQPVAAWVGDETLARGEEAPRLPSKAITEADIDRFRQLIDAHTHFVTPPDAPEPPPLPKNPPAAFILTSPRSGSTLLRVMLAGNPALFSPPELALLSYRSMGERAQALSGRDVGWNEGLLRALMELFGWRLEEAKAQLAEFEAADTPTQSFYRFLQEAMAGRMLVDKTTTYATDLRVLRRAETWFENARFIHLVRNPNAAIKSYVDSNIDQVFGHDLPLTEREHAELFWLLINRNILTFLQEIPPDRQFFLHFEDLVKRPRPVMEALCDFLGAPFHEEMLFPYRGDKMTSPVHPESRMVGDPRFHKHRTIEAGMAEKWQRPEDDLISPITWALGRQLNYDLPLPQPPRALARIPIQPLPPDAETPLSFAQQRLWFLDHLEPGSPFYNIASVVQLRGDVDLPAFEAALNDILQRHEVLRTTFHTVDGKPRLRVHPHLSLHAPVEDLRPLPAARRLEEAHRRARMLAQQPFDLAQGPLLRVALYRLDDEERLAALVVHHIVADGWSFPILLKELAACYHAHRTGTEPQLPDLPIQYSDFAAWQRAWLETRDAAWQIAYWREELSGHATFLDLPTDFPRPPVQTYRGHQLRFDLDETLTTSLEQLARRQDATLFMALLAGFQTLLYRYTGQDDVNVGAPIANRNRPEIEPLIGFFVNTLTLRADFSGEPTFAGLLDQVRDRALAAYAHQDAPFELVVDAVQPERDPSYAPLFQVMFAYQEQAPERVALPGFELEPLHLDMGIAKFDLTLSAVRRAGRVEAVVEYNADLFEEATIRRFIGHFRTLLHGAVTQPDRPVHALPLLTPAEVAQVRAWNQTAAPLSDETLVQRFARQAAARPEALAVRAVGDDGGAVELTYAALDARSNQLAHALLSLGLPPESPVGVMLPKSADVLVAILGVMKAGMAYLPLDPGYPIERLQYMIEDAGVRVIIRPTPDAHHAAPDDKTDHLLHFAQDTMRLTDEEVVSQPSHPPETAIHPDNLAYIIYTSGSTGLPKGVAVPHRGVVNFVADYRRSFGLRAGDRFLQFASLNFDASLAEMFIAVDAGGAVVFAPRHILASGDFLMDFLARERINFAILPPSLLAALPAAPLPDLRVLLSAGEACTWEVVRRWAPGRDFYNAYGPTETSIGASYYRARPEDETARPVPIGRPIVNATFYVLDAHMQLAPVGVPGELYIGGMGVTRGYLHRPDLTAARFAPDPFAELNAANAEKSATPSPGPRLYRTGDLVRWLPDGNVEFLGRVDHQVKVRGYRIELGEIERYLDGHPDVQKSIVVLHETGASRRLVAYFVANGESAVGAEALRDHLARFLPEYMIPGQFVSLETLPVTPSGKIDRRALAQRSLARAETAGVVTLPRDEKEAILARVWAELLGLAEVGVDANFFELGGDSILAIQMISRVADEGIAVTVKQLFQHPTIAELARVAESGQRTAAEQDEVTGQASLTPIQRWFFEQPFPHPAHWNQAVLLDVGQPLDSNLLQEAVAALVRHHDALRLRFRRDEEGNWIQVNASIAEALSQEPDSQSGVFTAIDLSPAPDDALAQTITDHCARVQGSLNLAEGPVFRAAYFDLGRERGWRLFLVAHHLVIDGVSWRILTEDLQRAYLQLLQGQPVKLPRKTTAFIHWARALADYARSADLGADLAFWQDAAALPNPRLPLLSAPAPEANAEAAARTESLHFTSEIAHALRVGLPATFGADLQTGLLAALAWALRDWTGDARFKLAMESHGRDLDLPGVDITRTVGWFTSLYPAPIDIRNAGDVIGVLSELGAAWKQLPAAATYSILRYLRQEDSLAGEEPVISFNYLGQFESGGEGGFQPAKENRGPERHPRNPRPHLLDITASLLGDELTIRFTYPTTLFASDEIQTLMTLFQQAVSALYEQSQSVSVSDDLILDDDELDDLFDELDM